MPKYMRKSPEVIDAFKFEGWTGCFNYMPDWFNPKDMDDYPEGVEAVGANLLYEGEAPHPLIACIVHGVRAEVGDWIIRQADGKFSVCKPDIFEVTYKAVSA